MHRQFKPVEPENRLVARTLEAALEDKLTAVRTAENQLAAQQARRPVTLTQEETAWITTAGADLRAIFQAPATTNSQRKELIRAVITEVTVTIQDNTGEDGTARTCQVQITWQGGASTALQMPIPASGHHGRVTSEDTLDGKSCHPRPRLVTGRGPASLPPGQRAGRGSHESPAEGGVPGRRRRGPGPSSARVRAHGSRRSRTTRIVFSSGARHWPVIGSHGARRRARPAWLARLIHCPTAVNRSFSAAVNAQTASAIRQASG